MRQSRRTMRGRKLANTAVMGKFLLWPGIYNLRSLKSLFGWRGSQSAQADFNRRAHHRKSAALP